MTPYKWFKVILISFFVIFLALYVSQSTGYYEYEAHKKVQLTNDKIAEFEKDVKEGKKIDVNDYLKDTKKDYNNKVSQSGLTISKFLESSFNSVIDATYEIINELFIK
jgi:archaellum component FlaF (FlaF/FlaG flagellin family)